MNIIELAKQAGINAEADTLCRNEGWVEPLEAFAKLVVANIDPKSLMSWQEGYEAGAAQEREECAELMFRLDLYGEEGKAAEAILARGTT